MGDVAIDEELGRLGGRRVVAVGAGLDAADPLDVEAVAVEQQAQLARRVAAGPQVDLDRPCRRGRGPRCARGRRRVGVERRRLVVLDGEVGVERAQRQPAAGPQRPGDPGDDGVVAAVGGHQPERALAQADRRRRTRRRTAAPGRRGARTSRRPGRRARASSTNARRDVDAVDDDPPPGQLVGVAPGPAADVEHPLARPQPERRDDVVDLLHRPLGERVAQVRRPEVLGDRLEPVVRRRSRSIRRPASDQRDTR